MTFDVVDGRSLRTGFSRHASAAPARPALAVGDAIKTYGELDHLARVWAAAILDRAPRRVERVGLFASRSEVAYVGTLAALYAGAAFVPLNHRLPVERTVSMASDAQLGALIVDEASFPHLAAVAGALTPVPVVLAPGKASNALRALEAPVVGHDDLAGTAPLSRLPPVLADDVAYLMFTSGSTGRPKGVAVTHANILHFLDVMQRRFAITPADRFSQTFDQTFDLSVFDLFAAWESGASVCAMRPIDLLAPTTYIAKHAVTVWFSVPSIAGLMRRKNLLRPNSLPSLRLSLFCGEALPRTLAESWQAAAPSSAVENLYGPTELTVACLGYRWDPARSPAQCHNELVPIGRPFEGLCAFVAADDGRPVGPNTEGELYVAGPQTVPGYWRDPAKTAERFVEVMLSDTTAKRFYRTGDRVLRRDDGEYAYLGRTDHQIKVRGNRVELAEIEVALCRDAGVDTAVAVGWPVEEGRVLGIVAFVIGTDLSPADLKQRMTERLPLYMVPSEIHVLDAFPLNVNGKIDRRALVSRLSAAGDPSAHDAADARG